MGEQLPATHYMMTPGQLRARQFASALFTEGLPLAPGFTETEPLGVPPVLHILPHLSMPCVDTWR